MRPLEDMRADSSAAENSDVTEQVYSANRSEEPQGADRPLLHSVFGTPDTHAGTDAASGDPSLLDSLVLIRRTQGDNQDSASSGVARELFSTGNSSIASSVAAPVTTASEQDTEEVPSFMADEAAVEVEEDQTAPPASLNVSIIEDIEQSREQQGIAPFASQQNEEGLLGSPEGRVAAQNMLDSLNDAQVTLEEDVSMDAGAAASDASATAIVALPNLTLQATTFEEYQRMLKQGEDARKAFFKDDQILTINVPAKTLRQRIGLLLDTFSPLTHRHVTIAAQVLASGLVDQIWLCPLNDKVMKGDEQQLLLRARTDLSESAEDHLATEKAEKAAILMSAETRIGFMQEYLTVDLSLSGITAGQQDNIQVAQSFADDSVNFYGVMIRQLIAASQETEFVHLLSKAEGDALIQREMLQGQQPQDQQGHNVPVAVLPFCSADTVSAAVRRAYIESMYALVARQQSGQEDGLHFRGLAQASAALATEEKIAPGYSVVYEKFFLDSCRKRGISMDFLPRDSRQQGREVVAAGVDGAGAGGVSPGLKGRYSVESNPNWDKDSSVMWRTPARGVGSPFSQQTPGGATPTQAGFFTPGGRHRQTSVSADNQIVGGSKEKGRLFFARLPAAGHERQQQFGQGDTPSTPLLWMQQIEETERAGAETIVGSRSEGDQQKNDDASTNCCNSCSIL